MGRAFPAISARACEKLGGMSRALAVILPIVTGAVPVVRMLNVLKAADLIVDDPLEMPMWFVDSRVVLSTSFRGSVVAAVDWLCPRLAHVWSTWLPDVPLLLAVDCTVAQGHQRFVVPDGVSNIEEALVALSEFVPGSGPGSYRWDASLHRWSPDDDDLTGRLVPRIPLDHPPHVSAAAEDETPHED